ncbi:ATP-binding cassette domain-containing protein [Geomicrobium sp. JCM 19039]|uniref:ATP-binding cassette domain-containing protein n=1 Tax=Geomicrobium sp. JCM 19039 TaxID=1460636 RepID=UPI000ADED636|nr:ATP-binding cassette domain-containing protein [Geomicrobium sp. JCM 19039]
MLLHARQLSKNYEGQEVFSVDSLYVYEGDRIGVVGDNGAGKSTLLSILAGELKEDSGTVERYGNAVYIPQLNEGDAQPDARLASLWRVPEDETEMSGGERTRKKIASAFGQEADVIIADEPTSHLDIQGIEGLERTLKMHRGAVLLTSHDKQLLNEVCTTIWEIENQTVTMYEGNYDAYQQQKQAARVRQYKDYETYAKEKKTAGISDRKCSAKIRSCKKGAKPYGEFRSKVAQAKCSSDEGEAEPGCRNDALQNRSAGKERKAKGA